MVVYRMLQDIKIKENHEKVDIEAILRLNDAFFGEKSLFTIFATRYIRGCPIV